MYVPSALITINQHAHYPIAARWQHFDIDLYRLGKMQNARKKKARVI